MRRNPYEHLLTLVFAVALAAMSAAPASAEQPTQESSPPDPCAKWAVNGYRVGMSQDAALAVRSAKLVKSTMGLRPGFRKAFVDGDPNGTLIFDPGKTLSEWIARPSVKNYTELRAAITERLGPPTSEKPATDEHEEIEVLWASSECHAQVRLLWMPAGFSQVAVLGLSRFPREGNPLD